MEKINDTQKADSQKNSPNPNPPKGGQNKSVAPSKAEFSASEAKIAKQTAAAGPRSKDGLAITMGDFIEIEYSARIKEGSLVFDTTSEDVAREAGIFSKSYDYGSIVICVGEGQVLKGLDRQIQGKGIGSHEILVSAEEGFGKKSAKLVQLVSAAKFRQENIMPQPGLEVQVDNMTGIIKTVTGGRVMIDFNHPLSSKDLVYSIKINRRVEDAKEKADSILRLALGKKNFASTLTGDALKVRSSPELKGVLKEELEKRMSALIPEIKRFEFGKL